MTSPGENGLFPNPNGEQLSLPDDGDPPANPLDLPQTFSGATSYEVRDEFERLVRDDLLGPWDGEHETFRPKAQGPRERYLVGMLGPKPAPKSTRDDADAVPDTESGVGGGGETDLPEILSPQSLGRIWASSMGLSFAVPHDVDVLAVEVGWGQYHRQESETDDGKTATAWQREPFRWTNEVRLDGTPSYRIPLTGNDPDQPGVLLAVDVRSRKDRRVMRLVLINAQLEPPSLADTAWLFQATIAVTALDGAAPVFLPIDDPVDDLDERNTDPEELHLRLLYRNSRRYAAGHNVAVHPGVRLGERSAHRLETTWLPRFDVPATIAPIGPETPLAGALLSMDTLAGGDIDIDTLREGLAPLADGYSAWLDEREAEIAALPEQLRTTAETAVYTARGSVERLRAGISVLTDPGQLRHVEALMAFRFANAAMARQRRNTTIAALREQSGLSYPDARAEVEAEGEKEASWRPFQLAFILLNIPALTDPIHSDRAADHTALVDLLFFPTGGGKTEAYLGLTAYTFAIRRLQGTVGSGADARSGAGGVAVIMRYTLRLLTAQQFQRAAALVCAAEVLRAADERTWGNEPFRIGLWVGGSVSPNWYIDAENQIGEAREAGTGAKVNVLQTLSCPWCGTVLEGHRNLDPQSAPRRVFLYCPNAEGDDACPFSRTHSAEGLPILTIDEEIYRYAPSLVIATVDKLAQLPWRGYAGILFGRVRERCTRHGYRHDDLDRYTGCGARHQEKGRYPAAKSHAVQRLRPPDLIIQDELHLISGALGTTVGLFEAAVDELCTWTPRPGHGTGPKIVASTATTKRAAQQVLGVFGRQLRVFPPQVIDIGDTFFSRQVPVTPETPGRRYLGVCAHGVRLKSAEIRLAEILLIAGQTMFDTHGKTADPYMTLVGYFNATRELAGMRRYLDDDVTIRVRRHGRIKGLSDRIVSATGMLTIQELTSRISSADISEVLKRLEVGFDAELDTSARRRAIMAEWREYFEATRGKSGASRSKLTVHPTADRSGKRTVPVDVVLATSMLQVGVDVTRFGLMVVTGQPKNTAEYIQASSRVGRDADRPGLVVTLYNWTRPRDLAYYEDFEHYHATFYRQVEALSVTPYTRRSLDRGTAATFVAAVRNTEETYSRDTDAQDVPMDGDVVTRVTGRLLARAEAIAGVRGRDYMEERLKVVKERWLEKMGHPNARLGYKEGSVKSQRLTPLLEPAGRGRWGDLTVGQSMRETENEINLLVPGGKEIFAPAYGEPPWSFTPPDNADNTPDDTPDGDELGDSDLLENRSRR